MAKPKNQYFRCPGQLLVAIKKESAKSGRSVAEEVRLMIQFAMSKGYSEANRLPGQN